LRYWLDIWYVGV